MKVTDLVKYKAFFGSGGGGGGSSDFTTAKVTVINNAINTVYASIPAEYEENELGEGSPAMLFCEPFFANGETTTINVPLYKGSCCVIDEPFQSYSLSIKGDIQRLEGMLLITGDGTITISDQQ